MQIIRAKAREMGLIVNNRIDERRIPETAIPWCAAEIRKYFEEKDLLRYALAAWELGPNGNVKKPNNKYMRTLVEFAVYYAERREQEREEESRRWDRRLEEDYRKLKQMYSDQAGEQQDTQRMGPAMIPAPTNQMP